MKKRKLRLRVVIALIAVVILFIGVAVFLILNKKPALNITFKEKQTIVEYGVAFNPETLVESTNAENVIYPKVDTSKIGKQTIEFTLKSGKKEMKQEYTVEVKDTQLPEIKLRQDTIEINLNNNYDLAANVESVTDKVDGGITYKAEVTKDEVNYYTTNSDLDVSKPGEYIINVVAIDKNGNKATASYKVIVKEATEVISGGEITPTYINGILIVNKKYGIPADFGGWNEEASNALLKLQEGAMAAGFDIPTISGFRTYAYQEGLYNDYVATDGQAAADRYSAKPGFSEHQTGLCYDIGAVDDNYGDTPAGQWLAAHAHEYGFIIRYPQGKEDITGYMYEPWHVRYVGVSVATEIYNSQSTLEEYLGVSG